jgi:hypothetical protein
MDLTTVLGSRVYSLTQIKEWRARFETGDLSCENQSGPSHPPHVFGKALPDFLEEFPFPTGEVIAKHFDQSNHTIKEIPQPELGPRKFLLRSVPHSLSEVQNGNPTAMRHDLLSVLHREVDYSLSRIVTIDEF